MDSTGLAAVAGLLADSTRAAVCTALLDGRAWTAGELARSADVRPSTMSEHLTRLIEGGLLTEYRQGRHRYVALAGPEVATAVEQLMALAEPPRPQRTLRAVAAAATLKRGRTCYDHLAGDLGVAITEAMRSRGLLDDDYAVTAAGRAWVAATFGELTPSRRPFARACLDWTERRPHLAGSVGAHMCAEMFTRGWITRVGDSRAARTTPTGERRLRAELGLELGPGR